MTTRDKYWRYARQRRRARTRRSRTKKTTNDPVTFGQNLRRLRRRAGFTQAHLAAALGLKQQTSISVWERSGKVPSHQTILRLARVLACTPAELLEGVETMAHRLGTTVSLPTDLAPLTDEQRTWLALLELCPRARRRRFLAVVKSLMKLW